MSDILNKILQQKKQELATGRAQLSLADMRVAATGIESPRDFTGTIRGNLNLGRAAVIAEIKKASPSKGVLRKNFNVAAIASSYAAAGASCLSVLTDEQFFQGQNSYINEAKNSCALPVLRKDFIIDPYQIYQARAIGADAILLIAAALSLTQMQEFEALASELGMAVLVESHNATELEQALQLRTPLIGINNRNLHNFEVSLHVTLELLEQIPAERIVITESGILSTDDVQKMRQHHVHGFLVGEAFMRADDPGAALSVLFG